MEKIRGGSDFVCSYQDPNVIFAELDKGLHSSKIGEQCGAIVRYPQLFENYPFPIMIKSSFVKLANVFRSGTNFLRLCVLQVTQQCSHHLEKIGNIDDVVRCIHSVIHSNDPIARALTLKMLGSMACIIAEQKFVHHCILSSLDSRDNVVVVAALCAASSFATRSKSFSSSVVTKLTEMIEKLSVPVDMKLKFIDITRNMNCGSETLEKVRTLCVSVLEKYPSCKFVMAVLHTMTLMSKRSLVHLSDQVELLLRYLEEDARTSVKKLVLKDLKLLATCAPHVWTSNHVHVVLDFLKETSNQELQLVSLRLLSQLSSTVAVYLLAENLDSSTSPMLECCLFACHHDDPQISVQGVKMYVNVVAYEVSLLSGAFVKDDEEKPPILEDLCSIVEMKLILAVNDQSAESLKLLKECLVSTINLINVCPSVDVQFANHIIFLLDGCPNENKSIVLCEFLSAIYTKLDEISMIEKSLGSILTKIAESTHSSDPTHETFILSVTRLLLQVKHSKHRITVYETAEDKKDDDDDDYVDLLITNSLKKANHWTSFQVARQAARYGSHKLAAAIFDSLTRLGSNEYHCFWLNGLSNYCTGETKLQDLMVRSNARSQHIEKLLKSDELFENAIISLKAAATSQNLFTFQTEYIRLRSKTLRCLVQMVHACSSYHTIPPPAIASTLADSMGVESHKVQHLLTQISNCKVMVSDLERAYHSLYYNCFDADSPTLNHISLLIDLCKLIFHVLHSVLNLTERTDLKSSPNVEETDSFKCEVPECSMEQKHWSSTKKEILDVLKNMTSFNPGVVHFIEHISVLCSKLPICLPRFFFQKLQTTDIKLAVSPSMKSPEEPILVRCECEVAVKVEGIVNTTRKRKVSNQTVNKIQLTLTSELSSKQPTSAKATNHFVEACPIQGDYFCHKFLLSFPLPGNHQVCIEVGILDSCSNLWTTGTKSFLIFQSYDEAIFRQQQIQRISGL